MRTPHSSATTIEPSTDFRNSRSIQKAAFFRTSGLVAPWATTLSTSAANSCANSAPPTFAVNSSARH